MTLERAELEVQNLMHRFEDSVNCRMLIWPDSNDIDALRIALEAIRDKMKRGDDLK